MVTLHVVPTGEETSAGEAAVVVGQDADDAAGEVWGSLPVLMLYSRPCNSSLRMFFLRRGFVGNTRGFCGIPNSVVKFHHRRNHGLTRRYWRTIGSNFIFSGQKRWRRSRDNRGFVVVVT